MLMNRKFSILHTLIILNLAIFSFLHSLSFQTGTFTSTNDIHRQVFLFSNNFFGILPNSISFENLQKHPISHQIHNSCANLRHLNAHQIIYNTVYITTLAFKCKLHKSTQKNRLKINFRRFLHQNLAQTIHKLFLPF